MALLTLRLQALTDLDVSGCGGAGDAFLLQLLGGRFWDVRDCLPVQSSDIPQQFDAQHFPPESPMCALGVRGANFVDACVPVAFEGDDARGIFLLEQALQVLWRWAKQTLMCSCLLVGGGRRSGLAPMCHMSSIVPCQQRAISMNAFLCMHFPPFRCCLE